MSGTQIGLEIDGDRVTLVEVVDGVAVSTRTVNHPDLHTALGAALTGYKFKRNDPAIRVTLAAPGVNLRRIDVTAALQDRRAFEDAAFTAMPVPRETNTAAAIFFDPENMTGNATTAGIAVIAPTAAVDKVYEALGRRDSEVVAPPCVLSGLDGIWLAVRHRSSDVTLVSNGRPVAYRQLRTGGLDTVIGALGDGLTAAGRLQAVLQRSGTADQIAEAELRRFYQNVVAELRQTVDFWQRNGETTSSTVMLYGAGVVSPILFQSLTDQRFDPGSHPEIDKRLVYLPAAERSGSIAAFLAAVTTGADMPQVAFINPYAIAHEEENRRRDRRARRVLTATLCAGFMGLVAGIPYVGARLDLNDARADLQLARTDFDGVAAGYKKLTDTERRVDMVANFRAGEPAWPSALSVTFATMPVGAKIRDLSANLTEGQLKVRVSAELGGGSYADLTRWLEKLRNTPNVTAAWSESFTDRENKATFDVTFTLDKSTANADTNPTSSATTAAGNSTAANNTDTPAATPTSGASAGAAASEVTR